VASGRGLLLVAAGRKTKSINKTFYNAATLSRTLQPPPLLRSFPACGGIEKPPESMQLQQVFYAISVQFLNLYPVANLSTQSRPKKKEGEGGWRKRKPSLWDQSEILL